MKTKDNKYKIIANILFWFGDEETIKIEQEKIKKEFEEGLVE